MALKPTNLTEATPDAKELARIDGGREVANANQNMEVGGAYGDLDDIPVRPPLLGLEEVRILDSGGCLVGQRLQHRYIAFIESVQAVALHVQRADDAGLGFQRHS